VLVSHLGTDRCAFQVHRLQPRPGDRYLLASDGLVEGLAADDLAHLLGKLEPEEAARALVQRSQDNLRAQHPELPASDNMTAVVVATLAAGSEGGLRSPFEID